MYMLGSKYRLTTWLLFAALLLGGLALQEYRHEMLISKLLFFASLGIWARDWPRPQRLIMLGMIAFLWLAVLVPWYQYHNQRQVPLGHGAYRIENPN